MVVLAKGELEQISLPVVQKPSPCLTSIPEIDLSLPTSKSLVVKACEDLGFFKVTNHGIPMELLSDLQTEATKFFSLPQVEKELFGSDSPMGYGSKRIGCNGDLGWVEYLLLEANSKPKSQTSLTFFSDASAKYFRDLLSQYTKAVRKLACDVLEMMAEGLDMEHNNVFSNLVMDEESDCVFRVNHYPPSPELDCRLTGFGEHTDPQVISVLRSNNISGLEICLKDGSWVSVPSDQNCFFINVGDTLQVLTNGRFRSVKHRVLVNSNGSRVSMIYFCGPPPSARLAPLPLLLRDGEHSLYREFTWKEYKSSAYRTRLADNRLCQFEMVQ